MPSYKVNAKCFHDGALYEPGGKREVVVTAEPLNPVPDHFDLIVETEEQLTAREDNIAARVETEKKKRKQLDKEVKDVDFTNAPQKTSAVETL